MHEVRALESARVSAGADPRAAQRVAELIKATGEKRSALRFEWAIFYRKACGGDLQPVALTAEESAAGKKIPVNQMNLDAYFDNRQKVQAKTNLRGLMRDEASNFVDGRRS